MVATSFVVPRALAAPPSATCPSATDAEASVCLRYSGLVLELMDVLGPGSSERFAATLSSGYRLDNVTTETCVLGVTCDAWPIAQAAAASLARSGSDSCALGAAAVCEAVQVAASEVAAPEVESALDAIIAETATVPLADRVPRLSSAVTQMMTEWRDQPAGDDVIDAVVGVVALAIALVPAASPGGAVAPETQTVAVDLVDDGEGATLPDVRSEPANASISGAVTNGRDTARWGIDAAAKPKVYCAALFDHFTTLETYDGPSFNTFWIFGYAGIHDFRWAHPGASHARCYEPRATFTGSIYIEAVSNAGSFLASSSKHSPLHTETQTLFFGNDFVAATGIQWETAKVEIAFDPPSAFVINNYAPPVGNYWSEADGTVQLLNGYLFSVHPKRSSRQFKYTCSKQGNGASDCGSRRT